MRRLLLLRHAKAEPGAPDQDDHDRALTARGHADAAAVAAYLKARHYAPGRILCSTSLRTRQTVAAVLEQMPAPVDYLEALYLAPPGRIVALVQEAEDEDRTLMVVGHNPGLEQVAALLAREPVRRKEQEWYLALEEKFPTAALAVLDFDLAHWSRIAPCGAKLSDFIAPRDL